jgi:hypothetical protein
MSEEREKFTPRSTDDPGADDVEGHRRLKGATEDVEVEGHMTSKKASDDPYGGDDDVEGHAHKKG